MNRFIALLSLMLLAMLLAACGAPVPQPVPVTVVANSPTAMKPASTLTATPDLCSQANLPATVKIVNSYVYEFDKYASLSTTVPQSQLTQMITAMQAIRKGASEQAVPPCMTDLKHYALLYMDTALPTLISFQASPKMETLNAGIVQARKYNDQYAAELARLVGATVAAPAGTASAGAPSQPAETATPEVVMVTNPGPNALNLRAMPSLTAQTIGALDANTNTKVLGRSADGEWLLVEVPGKPDQKAWVYASLVQLMSGNPGAVPIATP